MAFYAQTLWAVLAQGKLRESADASLGNEFGTMPGVYTTPQYEYAMFTYGHAVQLVGDGVMWRFAFELQADLAQCRRKRVTRCGNIEWIFPDDAVEIRFLHVAADAVVRYGYTRFYSFDPEMELRPDGAPPRPKLNNTYEGQRRLPVK